MAEITTLLKHLSAAAVAADKTDKTRCSASYRL
jgi:hypothetical protein